MFERRGEMKMLHLQFAFYNGNHKILESVVQARMQALSVILTGMPSVVNYIDMGHLLQRFYYGHTANLNVMNSALILLITSFLIWMILSYLIKIHSDGKLVNSFLKLSL